MAIENRSRAWDLVALTVLALLTEQPRHPYEIQRLIRERHKDFAIGKTRALYHAVDRLVRDRLIEPVETSREGRRPERTVYCITDRGCEEFESWLSELLQSPVPEHPVFGCAMSFVGYLPAATATNCLVDRTIALEAGIAGVETVLRRLRDDRHLPRAVLLDLELDQALRRAELEWVRSLLRDVEAGGLEWGNAAMVKHFQTAGQAEAGS